MSNALLSTNAGQDKTTQVQLMEFLNRPEGHEVAEIGQANDSGFFKTLYILAPGVLDQDAGRIELDTQATDLIQAVSADYPASNIQGGIINASMQTLLSRLRSVPCRL